MRTSRRNLLAGVLVAVTSLILWIEWGDGQWRRSNSLPATLTPDSSVANPAVRERSTPVATTRSAVPAAMPGGSGENSILTTPPMQLVEGCIRDHQDITDVLRCLQALDLRTVDSQELGEWVCGQPDLDRNLTAVFGVRLSQVDPAAVFPYVVDFQGACGKYSESNLTIAGLAYGRYISESWYRDVARHLTADSLLSANGSDAAIQLAEAFLREDDTLVTTLVQDVGAGTFGGSAEQVHRAALISLVHMRDPSERLAYLERVYASAGSEHGMLGHLFAEFLTNGQCWADGSSTQALHLLNTVLHDPRYGSYCALQLAGAVGRSVPAEDKDLWEGILAYAKYLQAQAR